MEPTFDISTAPLNEPGDRPLTAARIRGIPAYRLTGVTEANRDLVKSTGMWVHCPWLGDEGWYLAVPDAWRDAAAQGLGQHGLGLEYLGKLPTRSNFLFGLGVLVAAVGLFIAGGGVASAGENDLAKALVVSSIALPFVAAHCRSKGGAQYGALLDLTGGGRKATDWPDQDPFMDDWGMAAANIPGSLAYNMWRDRDWD